MRLGQYEIDTERHTAIMAILNVTPDSFSDGGSYPTMDVVKKSVEQMIKDGAELIDIGGESTRPGYIRISDDEEISRILPVLECLKKEFEIPLSVDTYKPAVAKAAIAAGCDMVNDIWGLKYDSEMAKIIADSGVTCCLMHNRKEAVYKDFMTDCIHDLKETLDIAAKAGIKDNHIILDPGVGFAKTYEQNLSVMKHLEDFKNLGYPMLLGTSRKSMIGLTLDLPVNQRVEGTIATSILAVMAGYEFVRVHDVAANYRAIKMTEAMLAAQ